MSATRPINLRRLLPVGRWGWLIRTPGFTPREVRQLLREGATTQRGRAVSRCLARTSDWLPDQPDVIHCPYHYRHNLPHILFWYSHGESVEAIGRRVCAFGTTWGVERALDTACRAIARCLNTDPDGYGLQI